MKNKCPSLQLPLLDSGSLNSNPAPDAIASHNINVTMLPIDIITTNPWQPRIYIDSDAICELADNIKHVGLLQPILVRISPTAPDTYELIAGERRVLAYKQLSISHIAAIVLEANDQQMLDMAISENTSRESLSDFEISLGIQRAEREYPDRSRTKLAQAIGIPRSVLYRYLAFQDLPLTIQEDLKKQPALMKNKVASELKSILAFHGQSGVDQLCLQWKQVVLGRLEPTKLPEAVKKALEREDKISTTKLRRNLRVGNTCVGSIHADPTTTTIRIESEFIKEGRVPALAEALEDFLSKQS